MKIRFGQIRMHCYFWRYGRLWVRVRGRFALPQELIGCGYAGYYIDLGELVTPEPEVFMSRAEHFDKSYHEAKEIAEANGMTLTNPSDGCYQLRHSSGWIINMYGRRNGLSPRMYHDKTHKGPFLDLPQHWDMIIAVRAAIDAMNANH